MSLKGYRQIREKAQSSNHGKASLSAACVTARDNSRLVCDPRPGTHAQVEKPFTNGYYSQRTELPVQAGC